MQESGQTGTGVAKPSLLKNKDSEAPSMFSYYSRIALIFYDY